MQPRGAVGTDAPAIAVEKERSALRGVRGEERALLEISAHLHLRSLGQRYEPGLMELRLYNPQNRTGVLEVFDHQPQKLSGAQSACVQKYRRDPSHRGMQRRVISASKPIRGC